MKKIRDLQIKMLCWKNETIWTFLFYVLLVQYLGNVFLGFVKLGVLYGDEIDVLKWQGVRDKNSTLSMMTKDTNLKKLQ